ncbi:hypothetical protein [Pedobacter sp. NJ-S-72]
MRYLFQILRKIPYVQVVGHTDSIAKASKEIILLAPDIILADIRLKDGDSIELFNEIGID